MVRNLRIGGELAPRRNQHDVAMILSVETEAFSPYFGFGRPMWKRARGDKTLAHNSLVIVVNRARKSRTGRMKHADP